MGFLGAERRGGRDLGMMIIASISKMTPDLRAEVRQPRPALQNWCAVAGQIVQGLHSGKGAIVKSPPARQALPDSTREAGPTKTSINNRG